jgi:hypothetical protein
MKVAKGIWTCIKASEEVARLGDSEAWLKPDTGGCQLSETRGAASNTFQESTRLVRGDRKPPGDMA